MRHNPDESSRPPCPVSLPFSSPGQLREASPKQTNINTRMRRIYNLYYTVFPWFLARMCDCVYICFCVFTCVCVFLCMYVITLTENGKVYRQTKAKIAEAYCPSPFFASHKKRKAAESIFFLARYPCKCDNQCHHYGDCCHDFASGKAATHSFPTKCLPLHPPGLFTSRRVSEQRFLRLVTLL